MRRTLFFLLILAAHLPAAAFCGETIKKETRKVDEFNGINATSIFIIDITKGTQNVEVEAAENLISSILTYTEDGKLNVEFADTDEPIKGPVKVHVTMPSLQSIHICGAVNIKTNSDFEEEKMVFEASGATQIDASVRAKSMTIDLTGATTMKHRSPGDNSKNELLEISTCGSSSLVTNASAGKVHIETTGASGVKQTGTFTDAEELHIAICGNTSVKTAMAGKSTIIDAKGAGRIEVSDKNILANRTEIEMSGSADIDIDIKTTAFTAEMSGCTRAELKGSAEMATINIGGASSLQAKNFSITKCCISTRGSSGATVSVKEAIQADAKSVSTINYYGKPSRTTVLTEDSASINASDPTN